MSDQQFKADAGKRRPELLQVGMARALLAVQATMEYGAQKYEAHSWRKVPDAKARYFAAAERHRQERLLRSKGEFVPVMGAYDEESGLPHIAHEVFNLLALMELEMSETGVDWMSYTRFNPPPTAHKDQA